MDLGKKIPKNPKFYLCECCDYKTSSLKDFNKHNSTRKHMNNLKSKQIEQTNPEKSPYYICKLCKKQYNSKSGLWSHKKKCSQKEDKLENTMTTLDVDSLVIDLLKQNQELQTQLIELSKEKTMTNCHNNNTNNNHFNLQFFLNETCKDAISADQFVKDIQISFSDLENIGNQGYVQGFTDIIMKQLRTLDISKRPFHCTDVKRETIYIKDEDAWKKDNEDKTKLRNVIKNVAHKSRTNIPGWQRKHPEVVVLDSNDYDMNHKILRHTWGDGDTDKLQDKVVKNLAKEVHVDK